MADLPMIQTAAGWNIDLTELEVGDTLVIQTEQWPHNYVGMDFKQLAQYNGMFAKDIYATTIFYKPNTGITIPQFRKPPLSVFKKAERDRSSTDSQANTKALEN